VSGTDLHDPLELAGAALEGVAELAQPWEEVLDDRSRRGDVHRGWERVVGGLRHVHVVVRVDGVLRSERAAQQLDGAVRDDLVHVHVRLGPRARLPHVQREVVVEAPLDHLVGGPHDRLGQARVQASRVAVHDRCGLLEDRLGPHDLDRHAVGLGPADREVVQGSLGLGAPVPVGGDLDRAHRIRLDAVRRFHGAPIVPGRDGRRPSARRIGRRS
jgi:hypothetical protein